MRGWILYKYAQSELPEFPEVYEMHRFLAEAETQGIDLRVVKPEQIDLIVTRDDRKSVRVDGEVTPLPDFLLPRMGAGTSYFALAVIRHLERLGVTVINRAQSIENVKDKLYTQQILAANNLPVPKTMLVKFPVDADLVEKQIGFPIVIKTITGSMGSGVYLSPDRDSFADLMQLIDSTKSNANIILQEFISNSRGRDLRVFVTGGRVVACMERRATDGGFKANIARGGMGHPHPSSPEIELLALECARLLDLDIAGVDLLFDGDYFKVCEVNSAPHFKGIEASYPDLNMAAEVFRYVRLRLGEFGGQASSKAPASLNYVAQPAALPEESGTSPDGFAG